MSPAHYKHYKNHKTYRLVDLVKREEDWEDLVVYECVDDPEPRLRACRPATEFFGWVWSLTGEPAAPRTGPTAANDVPVRRYLPLSGR